MGGWNPTAGLRTGADPNAPLSGLLPKAPVPYENTLQPSVSSQSKLQYLSDILGKSGTETLGAGTSLLGKPLDYWQKLLQPPTRQGLLERQGPAVSSVVGQYSTGKQALERLPRGGGTSATLANLPFQESGDITGLLEREVQQYLDVLQPAAAAGIAGVGQGLQSLGLNEADMARGGKGTLIAAQLEKRGQNMQLLQAYLKAAMQAAAGGAGG